MTAKNSMTGRCMFSSWSARPAALLGLSIALSIQCGCSSLADPADIAPSASNPAPTVAEPARSDAPTSISATETNASPPPVRGEPVEYTFDPLAPKFTARLGTYHKPTMGTTFLGEPGDNT